MIFEFRVKNYLSFREEQVLSFEASNSSNFASQYFVEVKEGVHILKLGLIYGANAAGKSNLLQALDFLHRFVLKQRQDKSQSTGCVPFQFDPSYLDMASEFYLCFYIKETKFIYTLRLKQTHVLYEKLIYYPSNQPALVYERTFDDKTEKSVVKFGSRIALDRSDKTLISGLTIANSSVISSFAKANVQKSIFNDVYEWFSNNFMRMILPTTDLFAWTSSRIEKDEFCKNFVLDVLAKADFNISAIDIEEKEISVNKQIENFISVMDTSDDLKNEILKNKKFKTKDITFLHKTKLSQAYLSKNLESNGTLRFYGLSGILNKLLTSSCFLAIDEIENSLHHDLVAHFLKTFLLNSQNSQLLFTTHDTNLLNEDFLRRDVVWFVEKNDLGESVLFSLLDFKLHKNLSPFNAYKIGKLGAKPNLGDIVLTGYGEEK
ncbi:MAG: ATP-binding protein [Spirochaetota bacterium]